MSGLRERADASAQVVVADLEALELTDDDDHHLRRVLRLREGERVVAVDGAGSWRLCTVAPHGLEAASTVRNEDAPTRSVAVWLPALKGDRAEWAVQKLTELGVDEIGLLRCARDARPSGEDATQRLLARWRRVAREAACQSRRTRLPAILGPLDVEGAVSRGVRRCDLDGSLDPSQSDSLCVGPEGGWADTERPASDEAAGLGDTVLRTETAAVVAGALLAAARRRHGAVVDAS